ncbi:MAG: primosomal protein N', partial [Deltaproteobacteria bacterium]|nr:primosomal protein N' [Deltaproteobacteria bacterium]
MSVVTVALLVPPFQAYSYLWPFGEECPPLPGLLLKVPLGPRQVPGCLLNADGAYRDDLRAVEHCSKDPLFPSAMVAFFEWTARYYHASPGEVLATALPAAILSGARRVTAPELVYTASQSDALPRGACMRRILEWLRGNGPATGSQLRAHFPLGNASLARLVAEGLVTKQGLSPNVAAPSPSLPEVEPLRLTSEQEAALSQVRTALASETFAPFLLYGVTGSGKTEVYLEAVREARRRGGTALVMTPEIALTPQLVARFRERLGEGLVVLHSGLAERARQAAWQAVQSGAADVVIGTRSAVFAPFERLALVVVDEEHDSSYKQGQGLRYNARDLALWRARNDGAVALLGSATPSLGTFLRARQGKTGLLTLERRVGGRPLPEVKLVDRSGGKKRGALSDELAAALEENLERGEQSLLLLNRR